MNPRYDLSCEFLLKLAPEGPWSLTAIPLDKKDITGRTFTDIDELRKWLEVEGETKNVYYALNPLLRAIRTKAKREDVKEMAWLHVDIDPRAGEDISEEQARALKMLQEPPSGVKPTAIVFSGGGYQGLWKLRVPMLIDGREDLYEDAKLYNIQLETMFGADHCHNVDRILRLPGTVNRPDEKKQARGRVPTLAELVEWHDDRVYDLEEEFKKARPNLTRGSSSAGQAPESNIIVEISGNIPPIESIDDSRLDKVSQNLKVVIVQGEDPDDPTRFRKDGGSEVDRSSALFHVCCEMIRAGCDDDTIYAVITHKDFAISASVLEHGSGRDKYAQRQIRRAKEKAIDPELVAMNDQYFVVKNFGGKCRVVQDVFDDTLGCHILAHQGFQDFKNAFLNKTIETMTADGKPKFVNKAEWWLRHKNRREYDKVVFLPDRDPGPQLYNLWQGFACEAIPGDCSVFLSHVKENICGNNEDHYNYLIGWMANTVQNPGQPARTSVVLRGEEGTGKGMFANHFGSLFGRHYITVTDASQIVGKFNSHLRGCVFLFADEAFFAGDKAHRSGLKALITETLTRYESKGVDSEAGVNCVHMVMASNEEWVAPVGLGDRRFLVLDVSKGRRRDYDYFQRLNEAMSNGGREALLHYLMTYDLAAFNVFDIPSSKAHTDQKLLTMDPIESWWYEKLQAGLLMPTHARWESEIVGLELTHDFQYRHKMTRAAVRGTSTRIGHKLKKFLPGGIVKSQRAMPVDILNFDGGQINVKRPVWYAIPSLEECRAHWDANFGGPYQWDEVMEMDEEESPF